MTIDLMKLGADWRHSFAAWSEELKVALDRELHLLHVGYQDQAFLATTKGAAYRHLEAAAQRMAGTAGATP